MGFLSKAFAQDYKNTIYRTGISLYGTFGFLLDAGISTYYDPIISKLTRAVGKNWGPAATSYPWGFHVLWLGIPVYLFLYYAPRLADSIGKRWITNSLHYSLFVFFGYSILCAFSILDFGMNPGGVIVIPSMGFIVGFTEYLVGYEFDFSFASNREILREARIEKIKMLHKKWFSVTSALVTIAVAVCITGALRLSDSWRNLFGPTASYVMSQEVGAEVIYAGIGLMLGPFAQLFRIIGLIEDQFQKIESR